MTWNDIRLEAQRDLHKEFAIPATYTPPNGGAPVQVTVRYHTRKVVQGDFADEGFTNVVEDISKIIFLVDEVTPERGGVVAVLGYTFAVEFVDPPDGSATIGANVRLDL